MKTSEATSLKYPAAMAKLKPIIGPLGAKLQFDDMFDFLIYNFQNRFKPLRDTPNRILLVSAICSHMSMRIEDISRKPIP